MLQGRIRRNRPGTTRRIGRTRLRTVNGNHDATLIYSHHITIQHWQFIADIRPLFKGRMQIYHSRMRSVRGRELHSLNLGYKISHLSSLNCKRTVLLPDFAVCVLLSLHFDSKCSYPSRDTRLNLLRSKLTASLSAEPCLRLLRKESG